MQTSEEKLALKLPDLTFVKEMIDIIKNKLLFFMPFFGAFLAFLLTRHEYVIGANWIIKILCIVTLGAGLCTHIKWCRRFGFSITSD